MENTAYLSNQGEYTVFDYSNLSIRFRTSRALERYTKVIEWDNGLSCRDGEVQGTAGSGRVY